MIHPTRRPARRQAPLAPRPDESPLGALRILLNLKAGSPPALAARLALRRAGLSVTIRRPTDPAEGWAGSVLSWAETYLGARQRSDLALMRAALPHLDRLGVRIVPARHAAAKLREGRR